MPLVLDGKFAFHSQPPVAYEFIKRHFSNQEVCKLTEVHLVKAHYINLVAQRNSTFAEFFKITFVLLFNIMLEENNNSHKINSLYFSILKKNERFS